MKTFICIAHCSAIKRQSLKYFTLTNGAYTGSSRHVHAYWCGETSKGWCLNKGSTKVARGLMGTEQLAFIQGNIVKSLQVQH